MKFVEKLRAKLEKEELCFGTHCFFTDPDFYEICGMLGYDYIWIDSEHASVSFPMLKTAILATQAGGISAIVRAADHQVCNAKPILEAGADGIVFPMVNTAEEARHCVALCTYPPKGERGFGPLRAQEYGMMPLKEYLEYSQRSVLKLMQCEHVESVRNLDEILEVEGVDGIVCGAMDLSASVGKLGNYFDPEVVDLMQQIVDKCKAHGKPFGISQGADMKLAEFWISRGATLVSIGNPMDYFRDKSREMIQKVRSIEVKR